MKNPQDMTKAEGEARLSALHVLIVQNEGMAEAAYGCGAILDSRSYAATAQLQREEYRALEAQLALLDSV